MRLPVIALLIAATTPAAAQDRARPFTIAATGEGHARLDDALMAVRGQDATILIAPGVYRECGIQQAGRITFRARVPHSVVFDGVTCEGKAALVLRGGGSTVEGIVFRNMRVGDGNGAGIRIEIGDLTVIDSIFLDSQEGILGMVDGAATVTVDRSTFAGLGQCDETPDCAHSIYVGNRGSVTVTRSRFERGRGGHYLKLRTPVVRIVDNSFDDSAGRKTNYAIDLPNGATGVIAGNSFVQGPAKENWGAIIAVAAEDRTHSSAGLRVENNDARLAAGQTKSPVFVANASGQKLAVGANRLGPGVRGYEAR